MQEVKEDILKLWEEKQLRITDEIQSAPEVLYANGSVIGTLGNFSASTGKAKSKKTFNVSSIVGASLVNGKVLGYTAEFPDDQAAQFSTSIPNRVRIIVRKLWNVPCDWRTADRHPPGASEIRGIAPANTLIAP